VDESQSQPRAQQQPVPQQAQQRRMRSWLTADGQTSRRPRVVAGQRAAAKRAGQSALTAQQQSVATVEPDRDDEVAASAAGTVTADAVTASEVTESVVAESESESELDIEPELESDVDAAADAAEPASSPRIRTRSRRQRMRASKSTQSRGVRRAVVTAVLAVALIAVVAIGAVLTVQYRDAIRTDHARTAAMAAAKREAPVIFSYDYRHLDQDFTKAEAFLTGSFRDQYAKTTQTVVKPTALQYHGVVKATVAQPADGSAAAVSVVSASPDQVVVLAFIDQSTTSTRVTGTQVDQNRVLLTLTHTSQGWLVSAVDAL
jgi:Mce-associated membrane protein